MSLAKQEIIGMYKEVKNSVSNAITDISAISLSNPEEQQHIVKIKDRLSEISLNFNEDIDNLEKNSEWEKFTIAFFGETNAGKSTIIESLRIIFKEKERQHQIENGQALLDDLEKSFSENSDLLISNLNQKMKDYSDEFRSIKTQLSEIKRENKPKVNTALVAFLSIVIGIVLTLIYQWMM